jgi:hypothetical protein
MLNLTRTANLPAKHPSNLFPLPPENQSPQLRLPLITNPNAGKHLPIGEIMNTVTTTSVIQREPELLGQTVVVIGASASIGLETARRARAEGAR